MGRLGDDRVCSQAPLSDVVACDAEEGDPGGTAWCEVDDCEENGEGCVPGADGWTCQWVDYCD
ncbi:MAG: hypothetical protein GY913_04490 [Proteobacteria bacterium]|nr:hypothetical protein [Pseudomonadota bacterium]MCP4916160.1 hypothetical protein [Pseudomonadota bacterium]